MQTINLSYSNLIWPAKYLNYLSLFVPDLALPLQIFFGTTTENKKSGQKNCKWKTASPGRVFFSNRTLFRLRHRIYFISLKYYDIM